MTYALYDAVEFSPDDTFFSSNLFLTIPYNAIVHIIIYTNTCNIPHSAGSNVVYYMNIVIIIIIYEVETLRYSWCSERKKLYTRYIFQRHDNINNTIIVDRLILKHTTNALYASIAHPRIIHFNNKIIRSWSRILRMNAHEVLHPPSLKFLPILLNWNIKNVLEIK